MGKSRLQFGLSALLVLVAVLGASCHAWIPATGRLFEMLWNVTDAGTWHPGFAIISVFDSVCMIALCFGGALALAWIVEKRV